MITEFESRKNLNFLRAFFFSAITHPPARIIPLLDFHLRLKYTRTHQFQYTLLVNNNCNSFDKSTLTHVLLMSSLNTGDRKP